MTGHALLGQMHGDKSREAARLLLGRAEPKQQLITRRQIFRQQVAQFPNSNRANLRRRMACSLARRPALFASTYNSPSSANSFTSTELAHFLPRQRQPFFLILLNLARGVPTK